MTIETISALAAWTGYFDEPVKKSFNAGEEKDKNESIKKRFEKKTEKIQPIYNAEGKIIEYNNSGKYLDTTA